MKHKNSRKAAWVVCKGLALALCAALFICAGCSAPATGNNGVVLTFDLKNEGKIIENKFAHLLAHKDFESATAMFESDDYFSGKYPFVKRVELINATGGNAKYDLFEDPNDRTTLNDYKFDSLITACRNIVRFGLKPYIVTGNVPLKFCAEPYISTEFNVNVRPPDDYEEYYNYINAIATALVMEFGLDEVKTWSWGVLTEYDNKDWFCAADGTPESTKIAYFKLYDYTVAALQDAIGAENLTVGAHGMVQHYSFWDVREFIEHCARGTNYKTGKKGSQINFLTTSYYDDTPGYTVFRTLDDCINLLRDKAEEVGLKGLKYGADEGRILKGLDGKPLTTREVAMSFQAAADARLFKNMIESDINWFAARGLTASGIWEGVETVATHVANLGYKMTGDAYITPQITGFAQNSENRVEGIGGYNKNTKTAHIMIYNYNADPEATGTEQAVVKINNIGFINGSKVTVKQWIVDDNHGNFWPQWWKDMQANGITTDSFSWSMFSTTGHKYITNNEHKYVWYQNEQKYYKLSKLNSTTTTVEVKNGSITLPVTLDHHAVVFYEITAN